MNSSRSRKKNIFQLCFPCICKPLSKNDVIDRYYEEDFTDYEYVIENLAIHRVPKVFLDPSKFQSKKSSKKIRKDGSSIDITKSHLEPKTQSQDKIADDAHTHNRVKNSPKDKKLDFVTMPPVELVPRYPKDIVDIWHQEIFMPKETYGKQQKTVTDIHQPDELPKSKVKGMTE